MPAIFELHHTVRPDEIDGQNHVNNVCYLHWMMDAAVEHSSAQGWTPERYRTAGVGWVVRSHHIDYLQSAYLGEEILVQTWIGDFKRISSLRKFRIVRPIDGTLLATAQTNFAFIDLAKKGPCRIPPEVGEAFEIVPSEREPK